MENLTADDWLVIYVLGSGLLFWPTIRPPFARWYRSQTWIMAGANPIDILFKQLGFWLMFEGFVFALSCVIGALGGGAFIVIKILATILGAIFGKKVSKEDNVGS